MADDRGDDSTPTPQDATVPGRRRVRWIAAAVGLMVVLIVGVFAAVQLREPKVDASPLIGTRAPSFDLRSLARRQNVRSSDYAGDIYVVNFWASWCVPCRAEAPVLQSFYERWSPRRVGLVGVVYNDNESAARKFRDEFGLTYPQALDPDFKAGLGFGVRGVPETFVIDEGGTIRASLIGAVREGTLDEVLAKIRSGREVSNRNDRYQEP